jgi:two-component system, NtrC family, sensor kinase
VDAENLVYLGIALVAVMGLTAVTILVRRMVVTIERQREEQTRLLQETQRRIEAEAIWSTVGKSVTETRDLDQVLKTVIQVINEKMKVETGSVLLRTIGTDELYFAKILNGSEEQFSSIILRVGQGIAGWVAQSGKSTLVEDASTDSRFYQHVDKQTGFKTRSILCVPLVVKEEIIGVIELLNKSDGTFTQADLHFLESIAAPVAIAIQNARLDGQVNRQLAELAELFQKVERAKKEWEDTVDSIDVGISLVDENCQILRANRVLANWLHTTPSDLAGQYCYRSVYGQDERKAYCPNGRSQTGPTELVEWEMEEPRLGGIFRFSTYPLRDPDGKTIGAVNVIKDIRAEKELRAQMIQSQKLAATGRLAASLAHEINNPLQAIQACIELAQSNPGDSAKQERYLTLANEELARVASLVQQMLSFSRPANAEFKSTDIRTVVEDILSLSAKRLQHAQVQVRIDWEPGVPRVNGATNQLHQMFLNLILNAMEAMPQGGLLQIRGYPYDDGHWVAVAFSDSGVGIPPDALDKIFEPFYTTKAEGTGLGLSVCHNIVSSHNGRISVDSTVGKGSTFTVLLPVQGEKQSAPNT